MLTSKEDASHFKATGSEALRIEPFVSVEMHLLVVFFPLLILAFSDFVIITTERIPDWNCWCCITAHQVGEEARIRQGRGG